jgi:uncharacterized membrane protein YecN with MAPEG domain
MPIAIVPVYAALLAVLFVALSLRVIGARRSGKVAIGVGGDPGLERRMRVHANFSEYAPFALLLLALAELRGAPALLLHALCLALLIGRAAHAWGVSNPSEDFRFRVFGMAATFTVILLVALVLLGGAVLR